MTRWKVEFRLWAAREKLVTFSVPKDWRDWDKAKVLSRMFDGIARSEEFQRSFQEAMDNAIVRGYMAFSEVSDPNNFAPNSSWTWLH